VLAPVLTFNTSATLGDIITVANGVPVNNVPTDQVFSHNATFATLNFANKPEVTINTLGGADTVFLGNALNQFAPAAGLAALTVDTGPDSDIITVSATPGTVPISINAGEGDDTVAIGVGSLGAIAGPVRVLGGPHGTFGDTLTLTDILLAGNPTYTLTP